MKGRFDGQGPMNPEEVHNQKENEKLSEGKKKVDFCEGKGTSHLTSSFHQ